MSGTEKELFCRLDYKKTDLFVAARSKAERDLRVTSCLREPTTIEWLESFSSGVFFDVGANTGSYSLIAASQSRVNGSDISVFSFEPHLMNFMSLCENIERNELMNKMTPVLAGMSSNCGVFNLIHSTKYLEGERGSSGHQISSKKEDGEKAQRVLAYSIDKFCELFEVVPNYLKIDVDGLEMDIVLGAKKTLRDQRLKSVLVEVNDHDRQIIEILTSSGLILEKVVEHSNHIFIRK